MSYLGQENINGRPAWKFQSPAGGTALIDDPLEAMRMGAPVFGTPQQPDPVVTTTPVEQAAGWNSESASPQHEELRALMDAPAPAPMPVANEQPGAGSVTLTPRQEQPAATPEPLTQGALYQRQQAEEVASNRLPPGMRYSPGRAGRSAQWQATQRSGMSLTGDAARDEDIIQGREDRIEDSFAEREEAIKQATQQRMSAVRDVLEEDVRRVAELGIEEARLNALATKREDAMKTRWSAVEDAQREAENLKVDPNRYWNDASAGQKLGLSVAMALGAIGSSLAGTPNTALQVINEFIDRDTAAQQSKLAQAKDTAANERSRFAEWMRSNDPEIAREQARAAKLGYTEKVIEAMQTRKEYAGISAQLTETLPLVRAEKIQALDNVRNGLSKQVGEQFLPEVKAIRGGLVRAPLTAEQAAAEMKTNEMIGKGLDAGSMTQEGGVKVFDPSNGSQIAVLDDKAGPQVRDYLISSRATLDAIDRMSEMAKNYSSMSPEQRAAAEAQSAVLAQRIWTGVMGRKDAPATAEAEINQELASNPVKFLRSSDRALSRLGTLRKGQVGDGRSFLRGHGLNPGSVNFNPSPETQVE